MLLLFTTGTGFAQCPVASSCTPGNPPAGNVAFGMGILNVNINNGAINNTTPAVTATTGYVDYSCTIGTTLTKTVTYPISIRTNNNMNENVRVWLDMDNNGVFNATTELIFSSNNAKLHTGTFSIPASAVTGAPLRMRVSADNFSSPLPTPCSTPQYSQVEDYRLTLVANTQAPVAEFAADNTTTCTGTVNFIDLSQNGPTAWSWNFGDPGSGANNTSTLQNPSHTFSGPGTYTVTLTAINANGTNTVIKTSYITYHTNVPPAATCTPNTISYCCGYGITNVNFGNGLMTNTSANGAAGYQDFTCTKSVSVIAGNVYPIALTSGANPQDTRIYIDLNNDGSFTGPNEMAFQVLNMINPAGNITIPGTTFMNTPLRMRIISDEIGSSFTSCGGIQSGQAEDYTIIITPNPNPPVAQFTSNYATSCDTIVNFTDQSSNAPTSWLWDFGDPGSGALNTSTLPNPTHIYRTAGTYTVTLTATNANGSNTMVKTNYITVVKPCLTYCISNGHTNNNLWISNVSLSNLNHTSVQAPSGYSNFTSQVATLVQGNPATLSVTRAGAFTNSSVSAWIDFNRNGTFEASERVMAQNASNTVATSLITIPGSAPLGSTRMRVMTTSTGTAPTNPCVINANNTEVEDYTITIQTNQQPPIVDFTVNSQVSCTGTVQFNDNSINVPTSWLWDFGDPASGANNTSTLQNPTHIYATQGFYTVTLTATNIYGSNTITKTNFINYDPNNSFCTTVIMPATGTAPTATRCSGTVYDPGGPTGQYPNAANSTVTIAPTGAATVTLTFSSFNLENNFDFLRIYDGPTTSSPLIGSYSGTISPGTITSTTGALTLHFTSDNVGTRDGFAATWTCTTPTTKPVANFKADLNAICTGVIAFQDLSTNAPTSWQWNFGDPASGANNTSTLQNPSHTFPTAATGAYTVTLIACNSFGCDTIVKTNYINIDVPCLTYCVSNGHNNNAQSIGNVTMPGLNNSTGPETNGYGNYTYLSASMMLGTTTNPVSVTLSNPSGGFRYVAIWIDFNKDGIFQATERVFNVQGNSTAPGSPIVASGNISIPGTAVTGNTRMRIIMSNSNNLTNPCATNLFPGETEDYSINIQPNTLPVVADFTADLNTVCTGTVQFTDASLNGATSWLWTFGDPASGAANTSTLQNPTHVYPTGTAGSYTVTLTVCKGTQCNTITKTNFVNITVPCLTYCASNNHNNAFQWISNVTTGTINNTTANEPDGYANYTYLSTNVMLGTPSNPLTVTLGGLTGSFRYVAVWIDLNKDGIFQASEKVLNMQAAATTPGGQPVATGSFAVPSNAQTGATRMRITMSNFNNLNDPCITTLFLGETEDYTINIQPNSLPTVADFTANLNAVCTGTVQFNDASTNGATSWLWTFGDPASGAANTSTLQNPTHVYPTGTAGSYTVTLTACKGAQCNTITKTNFVNITVPCLTYCVSNNHINTDQWISNVTAGTINNSTGAESQGYGNYTYLNTNLTVGSTANPVSVSLGNNSGTSAFISIWIDFNKDGIFQATEKVFNGQALRSVPGGPLVANGNISVPAAASGGVTRMRVIMSNSSNLTNPCATNLWPGETEDYTVTIQPNTLPPVANFTGSPLITCSGLVTFTNTSTNVPTSWLWNFGDPASGAANTSTLQNPTHTFSAPGMYTVTLTATNVNGSNTVIKTNYINYDPTNIACRSVNMPVTGAVTNNSCSGTLYDDGGPTGNYSNGVNGTVVIAPPGASTISITFTQFVTESGWDVLRIHDGLGAGAPLIGSYSGTALPNGGLAITSTGGTLTVVFTTDVSVNGAGFAANWTCTSSTAPPVASFTATPLVTCNGLVNFSSTSTNNPTSLSWNFGDPGSGAANTSTLQNPVHTFSAPGVYTVSLIAANANGTNTVIKTNYITYDPNAAACRSINMPTNNSTVTSTACSGTLYDDGGQTGLYSNNANGTVVIEPAGARTVSLTFTEFNTEGSWDVLRIYDGPSVTSPVIGTYSGSSLPNNGVAITSTGGAITIRFTTDGSVNFSGFAATWTCDLGVGLAENLNVTPFDVYPNPSSGLVNLKLGNKTGGDFNLEITNVLGEVLMKKPLNFTDQEEHQLDLNRFAKGVYFIRIQNDKTSGVKKIVLD